MTRLKIILLAVVGLSACTHPGSNTAVSESDLHGSCEALASAETGVRPGDVSAISTQTQPTGSATAVSLTGAQASWLCLADPFGVISGVEYGREG